MDIKKMKQEMEEELVSNILPFWINRMTDEVNGGFYGRITGREEVKPEAEKGAILNARILWTFSAAYRLLRRPEYLETATRAKRTLIDRFYDNEFGGVYWSLDYKGNPLDTKKQIYALGFAIYGLSEYARATGDDEALAYAIRLFETIEEHSFDPVKNGYCEALTREWGEIADMRLSAKDENERTKLSMIYSGFGYSRKMSVADYIESIGECKMVSAVPHFIMLILFAAALVYCLTINIAIGMWAVIGMMVINVVSYFRFKAEIEVYFVCIKQVFSMCACAQSILKSNIAGIKEYSEELSGLVHEFDGARRFSWIMATGRGGVLEFILDYIRMITHLDIIKFCFVVNGLNRKKDAVWMLYNRLGYFDALIAAASYKKSLQYT